MTTAAARKVQAKRARRPIYLRVTKLVDPVTGEEVGALVPANDIDRRLLRERRAELADACFGFLPARALLDLSGWEEGDIFAH